MTRQSSRGEWFQRAHLRSMGMKDAQAARTLVGNSPAASASGKLVCNSPPGSAQGKPDLRSFVPGPCGPAIPRTATLPDLSRLRAQSGRDPVMMGLQTVGLNSRIVDVEAFGAVVTQSRQSISGAAASMWASPAGRRPLNGVTATSEQAQEDVASPMRKSMQHACRRGLVQRITLDAKVITDLEGSGGGASPVAI